MCEALTRHVRSKITYKERGYIKDTNVYDIPSEMYVNTED